MVAKRENCPMNIGNCCVCQFFPFRDSPVALAAAWFWSEGTTGSTLHSLTVCEVIDCLCSKTPSLAVLSSQLALPIQDEGEKG